MSNHEDNCYRSPRGVSCSSPDSKRAQWNANMAARVLEAMFPQVDAATGETVITKNYGRHKYYIDHPDAFDREIYKYFVDIQIKNENGIEITPDIEDFCLFVGVSRESLQKMRFANAEIGKRVEAVRNAIAACKKQLAMDGKIPPVVLAIDFNNNHDYVQAKSEVQISHNTVDVKESISDIAARLMIDENPASSNPPVLDG